MGKRKSSLATPVSATSTKQAKISKDVQLADKSIKKLKILKTPFESSDESEVDQDDVSQSASEPTENGNALGRRFDRNAMLTLVNKVQEHLPTKDNVKYTTGLTKLPWDKIAFGDYTAEECKQNYIQVFSHLRKYRTLTEMTADALHLVSHSKYQSKLYGNLMPSKPKGPPTSFLIFAAELREKLLKENPNLDLVQLAKTTGERWRELAPKKKEKYIKMYEVKRDIYKEQMKKYREEHPEFFEEVSRSRSKSQKEVTERAKTPLQLFVKAKIASRGLTDESEIKDAETSLTEKWKRLSDVKRTKYVKQAYEEEQELLKSLIQQYGETHEKVTNFRSVLKKSEKEILEVLNGKPVKPPTSSYKLFIKEKSQESKFSRLSQKDRLIELNALWKTLGEAEKNKYAAETKRLQEEYIQSVNEYCKTLSEEEMMSFLMNNTNSINKKLLLSKLKLKNGPVEKVGKKQDAHAYSSDSSDEDD